MKHPTPESRVAALRSHFGSDVCHKCTQKHTGACKERFWGYCAHDKSCKSNPHQFTLCPFKCKALAAKTTNPTLVESVMTLPICNANNSDKHKLQKAELSQKTKNPHDTKEPNNIGGLYVYLFVWLFCPDLNNISWTGRTLLQES